MLKEFIYKNYIKIIRILICNIIYISMNFDIKITPDTFVSKRARLNFFKNTATFHWKNWNEFLYS